MDTAILSAGCKTERVPIETKFETVDGYSLVDIEKAERLVGPVRSAKKVLQRTTEDLIRHATYACAIHGINASGAAAALNYDRAAEDQSPIAAFAEELKSWATKSGFVGVTGLGLGAGEIGSTLHSTAASSAELVAASAVGSIPTTTGTIVIASDGDEPALHSQIAAIIPSASVRVEPDLSAALASEADAVFVRGQTGVLDHEVVAETNVAYLVGLQPLTTTARGLAVASRAGAIVVPDFITAAGPYLAALVGLEADAIMAATSSLMVTFGSLDTNLFVAASEHAETHLRTWTTDIPFGRPLAP